jgi:hypothetical protein
MFANLGGQVRRDGFSIVGVVSGPIRKSVVTRLTCTNQTVASVALGSATQADAPGRMARRIELAVG